MINIVGLNKADVLAALYNASRPQGMGFLQYEDKPMSREEAEVLLNQYTYFDYLKGRVMKLDLSSDASFDEFLYDRDNGNGTANKVIQVLREGKCKNSPEIVELHQQGKQQSGEKVLSHIDSKSRFGKQEGSFTTFTLGLSDVKQYLEPKVKEALKQS